MTKAELISYLKGAYTAQNDLDAALDEQAKRRRSYESLGFRLSLPPRKMPGGAKVACIILSIYDACVFFALISTVGKAIGSGNAAEFFEPDRIFRGVVIFLFGVLGIGLIALIRRISLRKVDREIERRRIENQEREKAQVELAAERKQAMDAASRQVAACGQIVQKYKSQGILHERYFSKNVLECIIEYLEAGRADDLKEALNLYEDEKRQNIMIENQRDFYEEQLEIQRQGLENQQQLQEGLSQLQEELAQGRRKAAIDGIISAIGTDNAIRARKEIERANGKIV